MFEISYLFQYLYFVLSVTPLILENIFHIVNFVLSIHLEKKQLRNIERDYEKKISLNVGIKNLKKKKIVPITNSFKSIDSYVSGQREVTQKQFSITNPKSLINFSKIGSVVFTKINCFSKAQFVVKSLLIENVYYSIKYSNEFQSHEKFEESFLSQSDESEEENIPRCKTIRKKEEDKKIPFKYQNSIFNKIEFNNRPIQKKDKILSLNQVQPLSKRNSFSSKQIEGLKNSRN